MPYAESQQSYSNTHLLPAHLSMDISGTCGSLQPDISTTLSRQDKWFRPRPNTQWQNVENQILMYQSRMYMESLEEDDHTSDNEEEENSSAIFDSDGIDSGGEDEEIIERFLRAVEDQDLRRDSSARLKQLFKSTTLERLEEGTRDLRGGRILLEDRNFSRKTFRPYSRSMTPQQLYRALEKKRYPAAVPLKPSDLSSTTSKQDWATTLNSGLLLLLSRVHGGPWSLKIRGSEPRRVAAFADTSATPRIWTESEDCQVERRTLYVSNPNEWSAFVLAATASPSQAPVLLDFIYQYFEFETAIFVDPRPPLAQMTLCFHLPFCTFSDRPCTDRRQDRGGRPLRKCLALPCMQLPCTSQTSVGGWVCDSQVSMLISVVDVCGWTAYMFEDTYYKGREPSEDLDSLCSTPSFYFPDALTAGAYDSTRFLGPREYFLKVLQIRIDQAFGEWQVVVDKLEEIVKWHRPSRIFNSPSGAASRRNSAREEQIILQQHYSDWISDISVTVSDRAGQLSKTLTAWFEFEKRCSQYFPEETNPVLETSIGHTFSKITILKNRLDSLSNEICNDQSTLGAHLAVESTGTARFVKALTIISILMLPMVLNIALFSIQPGVMPFEMNFTSFVISYFALASLICLVWIIIIQWDCLARLVPYVLGKLGSAVIMSSSGIDNSAVVRDDPGNETDANDMDAKEGNSRLGCILPALVKSIRWYLQLFFVRGDRGPSEAQPAGLSSVIYV